MRLEDHNHRRVSSPPHRALPAAPTPQTARPPPQESIRVSNPVHSPRHEDSHMPIDSRPSLPPINISTPVPATQAAPAPLISDPRSKEVSPRTPMPPMLLEEPPTRKMEVDENYDDEDPPPAVKKASPAAAYPRSSPLVSPKSSQDVKHSVIEADQPQ